MLKRFLRPSTFLPFLLLLLMAAGWVALSAALPVPTVISSRLPPFLSGQIQTAVAQPVLRSEDVWRQVYEVMPDLPLENQYVNKETREVSQNNNLVSRLIRYHVYTKGRTPVYRLDWKLTLADYLGANERISASVYPGADVLRTNPLEGDVAAINRLTRTQRDNLVQALVTAFSPTAASNPDQPTPNPVPSDPAATPVLPPAVAPSPSPTVAPSPVVPREPRPGDAQLLVP
jgi:hypothetical protein